MPVELRHPGVYVQELPSGVRTISGVATSVTAFVGRALRGPVDTATSISSLADFERTFGGLWLDSALGYAVRDFFRLGGSAAVIVRVHRQDPANTNDVATITLTAGGGSLVLAAASPGAWGAALEATVDHDVADATDTSLFNLTLVDTEADVVEEHRNVSVDPASARRVDTVLAQRSRLAVVAGALSAARPDAVVDDTATGGNDGLAPVAAQYTATDGGIAALDHADVVSLVVIPPHTDPGAGVPVTEGGVDTTVVDAAIAWAEDNRALVLLDPDPAWDEVTDVTTADTGGNLPVSTNAAMYFPRIRQPDPLRDLQVTTFPPSGAIAGIMARTDAARGVWKAPAGLDATVRGISALEVPLTDHDIGTLNPLGVNCLRLAPGAGHVVWGARTRVGADRLASEWKYVPVRRTALFLEESLFRGLQWVVFEPNDEPLWSQIRLNVGGFLDGLFRQGAFAGTTPRDAYFVKCDADTTTPDDVNRGVVNIVVGFAPLKPAEFVVISLQQIAGQTGDA